MLTCRLLGHRWRFWRVGRTVRWTCRRGCGAGGVRKYATAAAASRHLRHYAREPEPPAAFLAALAGAVTLRGRQPTDAGPRASRRPR
jgi:hypothetical protein